MNKETASNDNLEGKTFVIAGAAGFVPGHIAEFYLNKGAKVIGLDNFITGTETTINILSKYKNFEFHRCDVSQTLPTLNEKVDYVLSLASPASPIDFSKIPMEIMRVNTYGTWNLLSLTKDKGARFLEASTSEVYGDPEIHPQTESYYGNVNTVGPRSCYDESKRFAETLAHNFNTLYGVETRIVRIFNTYGPRMRPNDGRVIPNFINQALKGEDLTVYGDGKQTRSFCFVEDLVRAIDCVLFSDDPTPFNCGNPDEYSINECAEKIIQILGSSSKISYLPIGKDDPKVRRPDLTKLKSVSSYEPAISFHDGISRTAEYFKSL
ncbi:MAG: NAD-dependent dehydratase [Halobacteriovoraceae bacterium]|nr:NAD-dependent dehydratase [Halobacteriovoraceae bacterium]|tara:strand:+ start:393 stop:1361 length:969 start_codon:yes stop_codon:yes gene_type:complete